MAEQKSIRDIFTFTSKAAQCPSCFSFNHPEYLPEEKKQASDSGLTLTCSLCGTPYEKPLPQAA